MKLLLSLLLIVSSFSLAFSQGSGSTLDFDGTDDNLEINSAFMNQNGTGSFSFCAWIMSTNVGKSGQRILCDDQQTSGSGGYALSLGDPGSGRLRFYCRSLSAVSLDVPGGNYQLSNNTWYHVAATYNHITRVRCIYVNGELAATTTHGAGEWTTGEVDNGPVTIGGESNGSSESGNRFQGQIDEVSYWTKALSQTEIRDLMCKSLTGSEANLYGYWNLDAAATGLDNVPDVTGNGYTGTMRNMGTVDIVTSFAPVGSTSTYLYTTIWAGKKIILTSSEGDSLQVSAVSSATVNNVHIYHVDAVPNTTAGITGLGGNDHYYGVFKSFYNGGGGTYTATYFYRENDAYQNSSTLNDPDYVETNLRVFTRSSNSSSPWLVNPTAPNTVTKSIALTAVSTEFILAYANGLANLPVELLDFEVRLINDHVKISWTTASESGSDYFLVERSDNTGNFETLVQVPAVGNSNSNVHYNEFDRDPLEGYSYYRLKEFDINGDFYYSDTKSIYRGEGIQVSVYPNPVEGMLNIDLDQSLEGTLIEAFDVNGKLVYSSKLGSDYHSAIDVSLWEKGLYFLKIYKGDEPKIFKIVR